MNSFSWLIYLAGVVDGMNAFMGFAFLAGFITVCLYTVKWFVDRDDYEPRYNDNVPFRKYSYKPITILVVAGLFSSFVPSKNVILAIAASEYTEKALNTEVGQDAQEFVKRYLKKELGNLEEKKDK